MSNLEASHSSAFARIYLFESACARKGGQNSLKEFMTFLKHKGAGTRIDFALAGSLETLHANLSIKDNYILDSVPTSLIKDREDNFALTAENLKNHYLKDLIKETDCLQRKVLELSNQEKKLVSIAKGLLSQSEYLFLENPDQGILKDHMELIKSALSFEALVNKRTVLIRPEKRENWLDVAGNLVSKKEKGPYETKVNGLAVSNVLEINAHKAA